MTELHNQARKRRASSPVHGFLRMQGRLWDTVFHPYSKVTVSALEALILVDREDHQPVPALTVLVRVRP